MTTINVKRVYDGKDKDDGVRILVDRIWPRGLSKEDAAVDHWFREVAPSSDLRKWFSHDPDKWPEFRKRYREELKEEHPEDLEKLKSCVKENETVTLLFGSRETEHNNAVALAEFLERNSV